MAHFEIRDLTFSYPGKTAQKVLNGVNLNIERGEYLVVFGKSGCGKTTLLRHLKSVLTPHGTRTGKILFDEEELEKVSLRDQSSRIGYVMQNPDQQIVTDKVWHELAFGLESLGCDPSVMRLRVAEMASYFGIQSWFHKDVAELSGGQKQLLNLASVMAMQPEVLILDEPTSQLDPIAAADFLGTVRRINQELGTTVIITEHRLEDIWNVADRAVFMDHGEVLMTERPRQIGAFLRENHNDMFAAMPVPVQVFYGAGFTGADTPITVREGRQWLDQVFKGGKVDKNMVPDEAPAKAEKVPVLSVDELWFRYEKNSPDILKGVSFEVPSSTIFAVLGGNGAGKSTSLKAVCGAVKPYRGKIQLNGKLLSKYSSSELFRNGLAMLPQDPQSLFVKKTIKEELEEMIPASDPAREEKIKNVAEICDITRLMDTHPYDLSGGEQQRAALAKVLLTEPRLLLLDEPTKGMDSFFKQKFAGIMKNLKSQGISIIMVSHDVEFCASHADQVGMFFDGQIVTVDTPRRFFARNNFYTTAANRMARHLFPNAVTAENVLLLVNENLKRGERPYEEK